MMSCQVSAPSPKARDTAFGVLPMAPPDPFQQLSALNMAPVMNNPFTSIQKPSGKFPQWIVSMKLIILVAVCDHG